MLITLLSVFLAVDPAVDVNRTLDDWHAAAAKADEASYFAVLADDAVFLGTDASERWNKSEFQAFARPYFAKGAAWKFRATRRAVIFNADKTLAWFDEDLHTENLGDCRGSGVLRLDDGQWKIVHYNLAVTVPNERFDAVKKLLESPAPTTKSAADEGR
jgi:ketosteroid isomerase-like protein